jgi:hypothetical protein
MTSCGGTWSVTKAVTPRGPYLHPDSKRSQQPLTPPRPTPKRKSSLTPPMPSPRRRSGLTPPRSRARPTGTSIPTATAKNPATWPPTCATGGRSKGPGPKPSTGGGACPAPQPSGRRFTAADRARLASRSALRLTSFSVIRSQRGHIVAKPRHSTPHLKHRDLTVAITAVHQTFR